MSFSDCCNNICLCFELFSNIEDDLRESVFNDLPVSISSKINGIRVERNSSNDKLELLFFIFTEDIDIVYSSLCSVYQGLKWVKEVSPDFSHISLDLTDSSVFNNLYDVE